MKKKKYFQKMPRREKKCIGLGIDETCNEVAKSTTRGLFPGATTTVQHQLVVAGRVGKRGTVHDQFKGLVSTLCQYKIVLPITTNILLTQSLNILQIPPLHALVTKKPMDLIINQPRPNRGSISFSPLKYSLSIITIPNNLSALLMPIQTINCFEKFSGMKSRINSYREYLSDEYEDDYKIFENQNIGAASVSGDESDDDGGEEAERNQRSLTPIIVLQLIDGVTHGLASVQNTADHIFVLDHGKLCHEELMNQNAQVYYKLLGLKKRFKNQSFNNLNTTINK
ncbi:hypothetical protein ACTFIV_004214 [Dictyostelium citrinum]